MKLIIGLGNPGKEYEKTRHNLGFRFIDAYVEKNKLKYKSKNGGSFAEGNINGEKVFFLKPEQYMNLSGNVVGKYVNFYKLNVEDILVVYDDVSIDFLKLKIKDNGTSGGHNGIKNIIENIGEEFMRVKLGVNNEFNTDTKSFVLKNFSKVEEKTILKLCELSEEMIEDFIKLEKNIMLGKYNNQNLNQGIK